MKSSNIKLTYDVAKEMPQYKNFKKQLLLSLDKPRESPKSTNGIIFYDKLYTEAVDGRRFLLFDTNDELYAMQQKVNQNVYHQPKYI